VTFRKTLIDILTAQPRSVSSIARELGFKRGDVEDDLRHAIRSARASGRRVLIEPARCRTCSFTFGEDKLSKPSKCPSCRGTRLFEAQIRIERTEDAERTGEMQHGATVKRSTHGED
jgi:predicted Zn-ribbon and HTH transcriptional regulator